MNSYTIPTKFCIYVKYIGVLRKISFVTWFLLSLLFPQQICTWPLLFPLELASLPANSMVKPPLSSISLLSAQGPTETPFECPGAFFKYCLYVHTQLLTYVKVICEFALPCVLGCSSWRSGVIFNSPFRSLYDVLDK